MPARLPRWLGLTLLALVACARPRVTVVPEPLQGLAPCAVQVDALLFALTEHWASGGTTGDAAVGELLRQVLVDDPEAPLRLMYVTSHLDVATVVSPRFYRPHASVAYYRLTLRVESPATGTGHAWLQGVGKGRSLAGSARAVDDAVTQAVRELSLRLAKLWEACWPGGRASER
jgi:hypothetical protein